MIDQIFDELFDLYVEGFVVAATAMEILQKANRFTARHKGLTAEMVVVAREARERDNYSDEGKQIIRRCVDELMRDAMEIENHPERGQ
ncbi:MAG: hypothetical protein ABI824_15915 [Acidobacteriota bacterium]